MFAVVFYVAGKCCFIIPQYWCCADAVRDVLLAMLGGVSCLIKVTAIVEGRRRRKKKPQKICVCVLKQTLRFLLGVKAGRL